MRIEDLKSTQNGEVARISATVTWEDCNRPSQEIYFEIPEAFASYLSCTPHPFLVGGAIPAMRWREKRIAVPGPICPELRNGLMTAMGWLAHWHGPPRVPVQIESGPGVRAPLVRPERAASFLSGGVDSLATLRLNRMTFPLDHPRSIRDCLFVYGFDMGVRQESEPQLETYERALGLLREIADDAHVVLIPVFTNLRRLDEDVGFWIDEYYGAAAASVGHALAGRLSLVYVPGSLDIPNVTPVGSDPLLDPNFSSTDLQVRYDSVRFSRLDKVRVLTEWEVARQRLRVCTENPPGLLNCGQCDKCIRTMTELVAVGRLEGCEAFPVQDVSSELLNTVTMTAPYDVAWYSELIGDLKAGGRQDLIDVIKCKTSEYDHHRKWVEEKDWKGTVKRFDRRFMRGSLYRSWKALRPHLLKLAHRETKRG